MNMARDSEQFQRSDTNYLENIVDPISVLMMHTDYDIQLTKAYLEEQESLKWLDEVNGTTQFYEMSFWWGHK